MFFVFHQPNYSRWVVFNLLQVDPGLKSLFEQGFFGVKRTSKCFSRQPVDLVLEQIINASAARTHTGNVHMKNSIATRQCWAENHGFRNLS